MSQKVNSNFKFGLSHGSDWTFGSASWRHSRTAWIYCIHAIFSNSLAELILGLD